MHIYTCRYIHTKKYKKNLWGCKLYFTFFTSRRIGRVKVPFTKPSTGLNSLNDGRRYLKNIEYYYSLLLLLFAELLYSVRINHNEINHSHTRLVLWRSSFFRERFRPLVYHIRNVINLRVTYTTSTAVVVRRSAYIPLYILSSLYYK